MVESIIMIFLRSWLFGPRENYFCTPQSYPPCQGLVGNLLWAKGRDRTLFVLSRTHLEFFLRCHQGTILSRGELWGQVHTMDDVATTKGSRCAWADESVPYPAHKVGHQRFRETFGAKVSQLFAQIHSRGNGVPRHLLTGYDIPVCCQDLAEVQTKEVRLWICKSKARERCLENAEQRTKPRHGGPRQLVKATSKEKHHEAKEGHGKVVWVP